MSKARNSAEILNLLPPEADGVSRKWACDYLDGLSARKVKKELEDLKKFLATETLQAQDRQQSA